MPYGLRGITIEINGNTEALGNELKVALEESRKESQRNEIEIIMSSTNEAPKVKLNGEVIDSIIDLGYEFVTKDHESNGYHNFTVKYMDKKTNTVRTVSANKMLEG
ncbi:hypothetical protein [Lysinibacillus odysseyi]|uniref:Uncharacterized protein n=1 Tax=Lysinibacillus odysseyi 34hs-1 = NBRC 100172 TaxID=1220589 RepID=A0A0A3IVA5_9BACI|nr:hypothetical protein [Lysinibacillus odysseyi]KGR88714.1 hypothetical protein CD32_01225 [Lysinibacillus odysseyi 34hs-1 = NBRC 100172]